MKLTNRGNSDKMPDPIQPSSNSMDQPKIKLIYRAQTYEYTPRPYIPSSRKLCALNHTVKDGAVKLIYRGQAFEYTPPPIQPYRKPRAMNWRFQMAMASSKSGQKQMGSSEMTD